MAEDFEKKDNLEDSALIYEKRDEKAGKSEFKNLDRKGKLQFFKDYYLKDIIIALVVIGFAAYYLIGAMTKPKTIVYIAVEDDVLDSSQVSKLEKSIETYLGLNSRTEKVEIDPDYNSNNLQAFQQLQTYLFAGTADIVIAPKKIMKQWSQGGYFLDPETSKKVDFYKNLDEKDRLYSNLKTGKQIRGEEKMSTKEYNFAISVGGSEKYKNLKGGSKTAFAGISNASKHTDEAIAALQYILNDSLKDGDTNPDFVK